ncbi:hypothetical protein L1049_020612 [Liquidambar formosana]|uniref:Uncharacterized protein n=1 Tax=Liquidambar formosana TaxID=63359 RepID=A0AAP0SCZ9_LIQFO
MLNFWLCKHVTIIEAYGKYNCPRFVKWHLGKLSLALKNKAIRLTAADEVNEGELKLNETESDVFGNHGKKCVELGDNEISPNVKENKSDKNMNCDDFVEEGDEENVENLDEHLGIFSLKLNLGDDLESGRDTDGEQQCKMQPKTQKEYISIRRCPRRK